MLADVAVNAYTGLMEMKPLQGVSIHVVYDKMHKFFYEIREDDQGNVHAYSGDGLILTEKGKILYKTHESAHGKILCHGPNGKNFLSREVPCRELKLRVGNNALDDLNRKKES